jgi:hypothetical protein
MTKQELEKIRNLLQEFRDLRARGCAKVDPNDGDQGACYMYEVNPIDVSIDVVDIELRNESLREIAQVHSDINEKLFGYFKL